MEEKFEENTSNPLITIGGYANLYNEYARRV